MVASGELGDVQYIHSQRLNLGLFQRDINVMWDLAPHDISILIYILGKDPNSVAARGQAHVRPGIEDVGYLDLAFPGGVNASVHVSWLDPNKVRRTTIVGSKKMVVYDDVETLEKLRLYDKGVDVPPATDRFGEFQLSYRYGDISIPQVPGHEPLRLECEHFLDCIRSGATPRSGADQGVKVVQVLETANLSLAQGGIHLALPDVRELVVPAARHFGLPEGDVTFAPSKTADAVSPMLAPSSPAAVPGMAAATAQLRTDYAAH
jgi:predicted dehydrogenase